MIAAVAKTSMIRQAQLLSGSCTAGLGSSTDNRCTAPVTVFGVENITIDIEAVELAAVSRTWPTAAAGGVFAPNGPRAKQQQTRLAVNPLVLQAHIIGLQFCARITDP
jgi:hypothetical protein